MDADFSVELGADDSTLDFPWEAPGTAFRYFDIKAEPEQLRFVDEAEKYRELHDFLSALNSPASVFETAKCDVWSDDEISEAEEIFDGSTKFASYVDLVLSRTDPCRTDFAAHERIARRVAQLLGKAPEIPAQAEFIIRRCYFRGIDEPVSGFYITFYLAGYGSDEADARGQWGISLLLVQNALLQVSAELRR